jgi:hypothetical protein
MNMSLSDNNFKVYPKFSHRQELNYKFDAQSKHKPFRVKTLKRLWNKETLFCIQVSLINLIKKAKNHDTNSNFIQII